MYSLMTFPNSSIDSKLRFLSIYLFEYKSRYSQKSWKVGSIAFQVQNVCRRNRRTQYTIKLPDFKKKKMFKIFRSCAASQIPSTVSGTKHKNALLCLDSFQNARTFSQSLINAEFFLLPGALIF